MSSKMFSAMKKNSAKSLQAVLEAEKPQYENDNNDSRFWRAELDKAGNGSAVIRFLPAPAGEDTFFVKVFSHGFQSDTTGKWYIENSLTTIGESDPIAEANTALWKMGENSVGRKLVSGINGKNARKRKTTYIANILVVKDPVHPENNGKVFLFKYGVKIHDKIMAKLKPEYEGEVPSLVYDLWEGSNFKLKIKKKDGYANFDDCEWEAPSALLGGDDEALEALWNTEHKLSEFLDKSRFKTYDQLKTRFLEVVGNDDIAVELMGWNEGTIGKSARPTIVKEAEEPKSAPPKAQVSVSNDDDDLPWAAEQNTQSAEDFFANLDD